MRLRGIVEDWQNIGRKLPLLITALVSVMTIAICSMAYYEMKSALLVTAGERVVSVSQQLAVAFSQSDAQMRRDGTPLSRDTTIRAALRSERHRPQPPLRAASVLSAAGDRLAAERRSNPQIALIELWSARGGRILASGIRPGPATAMGAAPTHAFNSLIGPLVTAHDTVFTEIRLPIVDTGGDTLGLLREFTRVSSAQSSTLLRGLIGSQGALRLGNASGNVWTDLNRRVHPPRAARTVAAAGRTTEADGTHWIGAFAPVPRVPWMVWVAFPESVILAGAHAFLMRMMLIALVVIVLGAFGAHVLARHIIAPLAAATSAAETFAAGDYTIRVAQVRSDEVGRLAASFNAMAEAIQIAAVDLENQQVELEVQQSQLEETNDELRDMVREATNARETAERSRARAAAIVDGAFDSVITLDNTARIVDFNPAAQHTFALAASEAVGTPFDDLFANHTNGAAPGQPFATRLATASESVVGKRLDVVGHRGDGTGFPAELAITRIGDTGFTCFVRDLSERKELEAQLQQAQKMEAIGQLAGGVAHDFNNILTVIISYTDMVLGEDIATSVRGDLTQVRAAADRAAGLTRQLLAFSRKQVLRPTILDLNTVVSDVSTMLARVVPENIHLDTVLDPSIHPIYVDRGQLEQVVMNLVVNARDAMPSGGSLTIETGNAMLDDLYVALHVGGTPGEHVVLSVRDTGIGMDAATRARIFEPFFTTKALGQGTGLGLATVYGIVQQSGGSIYVYTEPGRGTTFKVYFRARAGAATADDDASNVPFDAVEAATVLLVEDDGAVREATRSVLQHFGHRVVEAIDVDMALGLLRSPSESFDVVLTDAVMPGRSGLDLAEILNVERPDIPVIVMSGYAEEAVTRGEAVSRRVAFLEKPFTRRALARALAAARMTTAVR